MRNQNKHPLQPIELIAIEQASHYSNPIRRQAQELMQEATLHDLRAAQQIMDALGMNGQVMGIERDKQGKPLSIIWEPTQASHNAPEEQPH